MLLVDRRDVDAEIVAEHLGEAGGVPRLVLVGEFFEQHAPEFVDQRDGIHAAADEPEFHGDARDGEHRREIGIADFGDAGAQHLDDDAIAVLQPGAMHLPQRRRRDRRVVKLAEALVNRARVRCSMMARICSVGTPGTSSRSAASSLVTSGGSTSLRVETNCPALIITPPISMAKKRKERA